MEKINFSWLDDMHLENKTLFEQFYQAMKNNDVDTASNIMLNNPQLANQILDSDNINNLINSVLLLESQSKTEIDDFLNNLQTVFQNLIDNTKFISPYNELIKYNKHNCVTYNNNTYFAIIDPPLGTIPTNVTYWNEYNIKGLQGYPGVNLSMKYNWSATVNYVLNDVVIYQNKLWAAISPSIGVPPNLMFNSWFIVGLPKLPIKTSVTETAPTNISEGDLWFKVISGGSVVQDKWVYKANMPTARYACRAFKNGSNLYIVGGDDVSAARIATNEMYDTLTDTWSTKQPMITPRGAPMPVVLNGKAYVAGGTRLFGEILDVNEEYDFGLNSWSTKAPMPEPLVAGGYAPNSDNTKGYFFCGQDVNFTPLNKIYEYTQATNSWLLVGTVPYSSTEANAFYHNNGIYLKITPYGTTTAKLLFYDITLNTFTEKADLPNNRSFGNLVGYGDYLYYIGGLRDDGYTTNDNQIYNILTNTWNNGIPMQSTRISAASEVIGSKIYVCGGADLALYEITNSLEAYTI